jgi:hypothetical protein
MNVVSTKPDCLASGSVFGGGVNCPSGQQCVDGADGVLLAVQLTAREHHLDWSS